MNLGYHLIASVDIGLVTIIQVMIAFFLSFGLDLVFPTSLDESQSTIILLLETASIIGLLMIIVHYVNKIVRMIPFPFLGMFSYGTRISEWKTLALLAVFSLVYCDTIQNKLNILRRREHLITTKIDKSSPEHIADF